MTTVYPRAVCRLQVWPNRSKVRQAYCFSAYIADSQHYINRTELGLGVNFVLFFNLNLVQGL